MYEETGGKLNVAMGSVLTVWHEYREEGNAHPEKARLPEEARLREAMEHMDIRDVIIDREASTVYLADPEMSLDVGAVAKGYAAEQVIRDLERQGAEHLLLNIGWAAGETEVPGRREFRTRTRTAPTGICTSWNWRTCPW